jgi:hypothetical protein
VPFEQFQRRCAAARRSRSAANGPHEFPAALRLATDTWAAGGRTPGRAALTRPPRRLSQVLAEGRPADRLGEQNALTPANESPVVAAHG